MTKRSRFRVRCATLNTERGTLDIAWKRYYYRVIGFALAGAGAGLVLDELIHGPFHIGLADHETWGIVMAIAGAILIARKPHGKD